MALPERRNPDAPRIHVDDIGDEQEVERSSRGGWRWWWIWAVVAGLVIWWATWGWDGSGGYMRSHNNSQPVAQVPGTTVTTHANLGTNSTTQGTSTASQTNSTNAQEAGQGVQILTAQDKKTYIGKHFEATNVPVQEKVNDHAMWIGAANQPMLAVVSKTGNDAAGIDANSGSMVNATGTVEKAPSEAQAKREWSLSNEDAQRLEKEGAYIQVSQLTAPEH